VEIKVRRVLRSRGAPPSTIDDAIQTAAERSLLRAETFDSLQGWINWTVKVAWHEVQAQWKRDAKSVLGGDPADTPGGSDPADLVEQQLELAAVTRGLSALADADRQAIIEDLDDDAISEPLAGREKMRRYRARRRLAALVADWDRS
jgi:DNA-directed RNA polymerase specialized sigma24 family protein